MCQRGGEQRSSHRPATTVEEALLCFLGSLSETLKMKIKAMKNRQFVALFILLSCLASASAQDRSKKPDPLMIQEQGSFAVGGKIITAPGTFDPIKHGAFNPSNQSSEGQTLHGDHAYVFYQIPVNGRKLPLVFWHGHGQFTKTWETTPDGREGFQNIFLRRRFPVYLLDQPRRGNVARRDKDPAFSSLIHKAGVRAG